MMWMVTLRMRDGNTATVEVSATNRPDAEYRAAQKAENTYGAVESVIACRSRAA